MRKTIVSALFAVLVCQPVFAIGAMESHQHRALANASAFKHLGDQNAHIVLANDQRIAAPNDVSAVITMGDTLIMIDPAGPQAEFLRFGRPDIVVLTGAGSNHLSVDTMIGLLRRNTVVMAPQTVIDQLPLMISNNIIASFDVGDRQVVGDITFTALPASAAAPRGTRIHDRMRGDIGVLMEVNGTSVFF